MESGVQKTTDDLIFLTASYSMIIREISKTHKKQSFYGNIVSKIPLSPPSVPSPGQRMDLGNAMVC